MRYEVHFPATGLHSGHMAKLEAAVAGFDPEIEVMSNAARDGAYVDGKTHPDEKVSALLYLFSGGELI